ncbi:MAG: Transposase DDE domain protein [Syntrophaceae bacterium PtaB.Bin038]|nr:MAG: Transposase DDE domain protein [Syntrophaceae bacterium PtaB.Bin038]
MNRFSSIFGQILHLFPRREFFEAVEATRADRGAKGFDCWDQFVAMLFCQLGQAHSLREICGGLASCFGKARHLGIQTAPKRSTLAYANEHRPWQLYEKLFYQILGRCQQLQFGKRKFRFKNRLFSLDASLIPLCASLFDWAKYRRTKGAVKLHLLLDHEGYLPVLARITTGRIHEIRIARTLNFPAGSIVVVDRGYVDFDLFGSWNRGGVFFVTRQKGNAHYRIVEERAIPNNRNILSDQIIELEGFYSHRKYPVPLRRLEIWDAENEQVIVLLTNHLDFGATTIAAIYKDRWQIEIFFKTIKQNLKIKTFVGTSANALLIQIWTALIAILVLKYLKHRSQFRWSLSNLVAMLRYNLFTYRDLWAWLDAPYETPPAIPLQEQPELNWTAS